MKKEIVWKLLSGLVAFSAKHKIESVYRNRVRWRDDKSELIVRLWEVTRADLGSKATSLGKFAAWRKRQLYSCQQTVQQSPREMGFVSAPVPTELGHTALQSKKAESVKKKHTEAQARPNPSTPYTYPSAPTSPASDAVFFGWPRTPAKCCKDTTGTKKV